MNIITKYKQWYRDLPEKKKYVEFVSALLTLPMLITVILLNLNNLNNMRKANGASAPSPTAVVVTPTIAVVPTETKVKTDVTSSPTTTPIVCKKKVGPVEIISPNEGQLIQTDPVHIDISYNNEEYCSVVWSYRINGDNWSEYTDKSIDLYNMAPGQKKLEVKVKSIASGDEVILQRNFINKSVDITPTILPSPISTGSANFQ